MAFWVETSDGNRGFVRQESIDEVIIVFDTKCVESNEIAGLKQECITGVSARWILL